MKIELTAYEALLLFLSEDGTQDAILGGLILALTFFVLCFIICDGIMRHQSKQRFALLDGASYEIERAKVRIVLMPTEPRKYEIVYEPDGAPPSEPIIKEGFDIISVLAWYLAEDDEANLANWQNVEIDVSTCGNAATFWIGQDFVRIRDLTDDLNSLPNCIVSEPRDVEPLRNKRRIKRKGK